MDDSELIVLCQKGIDAQADLLSQYFFLNTRNLCVPSKVNVDSHSIDMLVHGARTELRVGLIKYTDRACALYA